MGNESWQSADGLRLNSTYYWRDNDTLRAFSSNPKHVQAKKQYANGYHIVVSKVERSYGDNSFVHTLPNDRIKHV